MATSPDVEMSADGCGPVVIEPAVVSRIAAIERRFIEGTERAEEQELGRELNDLLAVAVVGACETDFDEFCSANGYSCWVLVRDGEVIQEPTDEFNWKTLFVTVDGTTITSVATSTVELDPYLLFPLGPNNS